MSQEQISTISGSIFDAYTPSCQEYKENRMPRVGQRCNFEDGRSYVFCSTAADVTAGQVVSAPVVLEETAPAAIAASGVYTVGITQASIVANAWKDGYLVVILGTGNGYSYRIKSNTASGTSDLVTVTLYDPLIAALAITDDVTIVPERHTSVVVSGADTDGVGVTVRTSTAGTDSTTNYLWVQTKGVAYGQTCAAAKGLGIMQAATGALAVIDATGGQVGKCIEPGATNGVVMLDFPS